MRSDSKGSTNNTGGTGCFCIGCNIVGGIILVSSTGCFCRRR